MTMIPAVVPPLPRDTGRNRHYRPAVAFSWLVAGWRDLLVRPMASLAYGFIVFLVSAGIVGCLVTIPRLICHPGKKG